MGNQVESQHYPQLLQQYEFICEEEGGEVVRDSLNGHMYFIREISISNAKDYETILSELKNYIMDQQCE